MANKQFYNRYNNFDINGNQTVVPYITLPSKTTDKRFIYKINQTRLDKISQQYYNSPFFGWLIMVANPVYGGQEWNIADGSILTIPYPLVTSLQDYKTALDNHFFYYGR
jgi:hypothetical protein